LKWLFISTGLDQLLKKLLLLLPAIDAGVAPDLGSLVLVPGNHLLHVSAVRVAVLSNAKSPNSVTKYIQFTLNWQHDE
jgi:hypothetical protein